LTHTCISGFNTRLVDFQTPAQIRFVSHQVGTVNAQVAQSVEQRIENPRVGGSIPPLGTKYKTSLALAGLFCIWGSGVDESHRCGLTDCAAISNERVSAKPAGDKQHQGCLDYSAHWNQPIDL